MSFDAPRQHLQLTIVVDNEAGAGLMAEHGLALWLETGGRRILFDTGQGAALLHNGPALGIDPASADHLVLSHGHYDHSGGLAPVLRQSRALQLHCHPAAVNPRYAIRNRIAKPLQMPRDAMAALDRHPQEQVHWVQQPTMLDGIVGLTGPIARETAYEETGGPFYLDQAGHRPDPVDDDLALWVRTGKGLVVCVGCAHAGLINTLQQVRRLNDGLPIRAVIGGFHLLNADRRRLSQTIQALRPLQPELLIPCHCTGEQAVRALKDAFGVRCRPGMAGMTLLFDQAGTAGATPPLFVPPDC
jgi:7,8-dihydropterin-6-yl-methyl-4-(beta-D-ribofuranosyl)aminobenzene 5'-phosphate synthase